MYSFFHQVIEEEKGFNVQLDVEPARYVVVVTKRVFWLIWNR